MDSDPPAPAAAPKASPATDAAAAAEPGEEQEKTQREQEDNEVGDNDAEDGGGDGAATPELPLTMSASVVLADLPRDAAAALAGAGGFAQDKVVVRFKAVGAAPALGQALCKISAARRFEEVVRYLRRRLRCGDADSVFLYVNSAFAPSLDEVVGNLHQCFKNAHDQLVVAYSMTPAFG